MSNKRLGTVFVLIVLVLTLVPVSVLAKKPGGETAVNNLSFPAIAVDGFSIASMTTPSFTVLYTGDYPNLPPEEVAVLVATGPWYPQKTTGNAWQADFATPTTVDVSYIDWGDNIESVNPKVRRPFRLEVVLFKQLVAAITDDCAVVEGCMTAYTMAVLEYPSSSNELQGTNTSTYESKFATVVSASPKLVIQYLGDSVPTTMAWTGTQWDYGTIVPVNFAPELNVGGKYVFGASVGGWKPDKIGYYRITFYVPAGSGVNLTAAQIGNYAVFSTGITPTGEGTAATPIVVPELNLTYVDVMVVGGR